MITEKRLREVLRYSADTTKTPGPFWLADPNAPATRDEGRLYMMRRRGGRFSLQFVLGVDTPAGLDLRARPSADHVFVTVDANGEGYAKIAEAIERHGITIR